MPWRLAVIAAGLFDEEPELELLLLDPPTSFACEGSPGGSLRLLQHFMHVQTPIMRMNKQPTVKLTMRMAVWASGRRVPQAMMVFGMW